VRHLSARIGTYMGSYVSSWEELVSFGYYYEGIKGRACFLLLIMCVFICNWIKKRREPRANNVTLKL
jgi:hypothetical protein